MKYNRNPLSQTILGAGVAVLMTLVSGAVFAQDDAEEGESVELDRVIVTGSRIKRTDLEGVSPVFTIAREDLIESGYNSIQDYVRTLTLTATNNADDFGNSFANNTSTVNLRGLGGSATLVLLNGRRIAPYGSGQNITEAFVDLNSIPLAAIERIEVLKDGASAIYGADAVAGVINVILRSDYQGAEYDIGYLVDSDGDAPEVSAGFIFGGGNDTTTWTTIFNYVHRENLFYKDRDRSSTANFNRLGGIDIRSSAGFPGTIFDPVSGDVFPGPGCGELPGTPFDSNPKGVLCRLNFNDFINFYPESERFSFLNFLDHEISRNVNLYWDFFVNYNAAINIAAPAPYFGPYGGSAGIGTLDVLPDDLDPTTFAFLLGGLHLYFPATNPFNPFGNDVGIRHRAISMGPRTGEFNSITWYTNQGIEGFIGDSLWDYDVGMTYSRNDLVIENHNAQNAVALQLAFMGVLDPAGSGDTLYYNPFVLDQDPRVFALVNTTYENRNNSDELVFYGIFTGPLFDFGGGEVGAAFGIEYRASDIANEADLLRNAGGLVGTGRANDTFGSRELTSIFAELSIPFGDQFEVQLAARYEDYSDFGTTTKPKVGFKWTALDNLVIRASFGESFRAPSLFELFGGTVSNFPSGLVDPARCVDPDLGPGEGGNAPDLTPVDCGEGQHQVEAGGNPGLQPEEAESYSIGVVWEATDNLILSVDIWDFEHKNIITDLSDQLILNLNDPSQVIRTSPVNGQVLFINNTFLNGALQEVNGVDFYVEWSFEAAGGLWKLANELTWNDSFVLTTLEGDIIEGVGGQVLGPMPEYRDNFRASFTRGDHSVQGVVHYRSDIEDHFSSMDTPGGILERCQSVNDFTGTCSTDSHTTLDLSYTYFTQGTGSVQVGCLNCFDELPPASILTGVDTSGYFTGLDDPRGLVLFARWRQGF